MPDSAVTNATAPADLQQAHTIRHNAIAERCMMAAIGTVIVTMCSCMALLADGHPILCGIFAGIGVAAAAVMTGAASRASRRRDQIVYLPGATAIDVAIHSVAELLGLYKRPGRTREDLESCARIMATRLQDIAYEPISGVRRQGYHPDGDTYERESLDFQWDLVQVAIRDLWPIHQGKRTATCEDVQALVARMVPPLRNILHRAGVFVPELEYGGYDRKALAPPTRKELKATKDVPAIAAPTSARSSKRTSAPDKTTSTPVDVFTPVEPDLNAAASLLVATLRTQIAAFDGADPTLFAGTDRASGRLLVDVHLPSLLKAYRTAHDASQGEERDDVRAQFAGTLRTVRDSLDQIMVRHAAEARRALDDEARFLASRDGSGDLDPS